MNGGDFEKFAKTMTEIAEKLLEIRPVIQIVLPNGFGRTELTKTMMKMNNEVVLCTRLVPVIMDAPDNLIVVLEDAPKTLDIPDNTKVIILATAPVDVRVPAFIITVNDYKKWIYWR